MRPWYIFLAIFLIGCTSSSLDVDEYAYAQLLEFSGTVPPSAQKDFELCKIVPDNAYLCLVGVATRYNVPELCELSANKNDCDEYGCVPGERDQCYGSVSRLHATAELCNAIADEDIRLVCLGIASSKAQDEALCTDLKGDKRGVCYFGLAQGTGDASFCDDTSLAEMENQNFPEQCRIQAAVTSAVENKDQSFCLVTFSENTMIDNFNKAACLSLVASQLKNITVCEAINDLGMGEEYAICMRQTVRYGDDTGCAFSFDPERSYSERDRAKCRADILLEHNDSKACDELLQMGDSVITQDRCVQELSRRMKDPSYCESVQGYTEDCIRGLAVGLRDYTICEQLSGFDREYCYSTYVAANIVQQR